MSLNQKETPMYTRNFSVAEMACTCELCKDYAIAKMAPMFMLKLQKLRELIAQPLIINSGFRCKARNEAIGGSLDSWHLKGRAADIAVQNGSQRYQIVEYAYKCGLYGVGIGKTFVHVDERGYGQRTMWVYD